MVSGPAWRIVFYSNSLSLGGRLPYHPESGGGITTTPRVVGRDDELAALFDFFERVDRLPSALLLEGEAGAGKTTLFEAGVTAAHERSYRVLACRPAASERGLSFAALRDLLDESFKEAAAALPTPQRRALAVALLREDSGPAPPEAGAVAAGFLGTLRTLARTRPVLVAVDDLQWLDPPTSAVVEFALRRLRAEPVAVLITSRLDHDRRGRPALVGSLSEGRLRAVPVGPLSLGAIHLILRSRLGLSLSRPSLRRLYETAGGNPFFTLEIARALIRRNEPLVGGEPLPVPPTLGDLVRDRIAGLSGSARELLRAVAGLSRASVEVLETLSAPGTTEAALEEAIRAGVLELDGDRLRFSHPLLAAHVYSELPASARRELHGRLARATSDPEERARHIALTAQGPDPKVAGALDKAARVALARGAPSAAAELSEEARRLTPEGRIDDLARRSIEVGRYYFLAGDAVRASAMLGDVLKDLPPGPRRGDALTALARIHLFTDNLRRAADLFRLALAEPRPEPGVRAEAEEGLAWCLLLSRLDVAAAAGHARAAAERARQIGDDNSLAEALGVQGACEVLLGRKGGGATVERAAASAAGRRYPRVIRHPDWALAVALAWTDDHQSAKLKFEELHRRAVERGDVSSLPRLLFALSHVRLMAGDWPAAAGYARDGEEAALQVGQEPQAGLLLFSKGVVDAHLGAIDGARAAAERGLAAAGSADADVAGMIQCLTLGFLEHSLGNPAAAHRHLAPLVKRMADAGIVEPGATRFIPDEIEALIQLGRLDHAESLIVRFERRARSLDRASSLAASGRCRGLLLAARGDFPSAMRAFTQALAEHDRVLMPFERGRTLLALGTTQRRSKQKRATRASLGEAIRIFGQLGAPLWVRKAESELARVGGRTSSGELTATELRVAELVAEGRSNKEVASILFVTVKTVEATLSRVYAKLAIGSRAALAHRLSQAATPNADAKSESKT